jgi:hypothetical protein
VSRRKEKRNEYMFLMRNMKERYDLGEESIYGRTKLKLICGKQAGRRGLK